MAAKPSRLDMTMMFAMHDALRRELERIARYTSRPDQYRRHVLATALGWELFKSYLRIHHTSEDDALWPVMSGELVSQPDDLALLEAMEAEHAAIDPLLNAIDDAAADLDSGPHRLGDLTDALVTVLTGHLRHEESEALPLIDATLSAQQWDHFREVHRTRIGADVPRYLPWLLDGARETRTTAVLGPLPESVRDLYYHDWQPAYSRLGLWHARSADPSGQ